MIGELMNSGFYEFDGVRLKIERTVGFYDVWTMGLAPFPFFVIKVVERATGGFQAIPNVSVRNATDGSCEYVCGLGATADEAISSAIQLFFKELQERAAVRELTEDSFQWSFPYSS